METSIREIRSLLFAPANNERFMDRLADCGADAVVIDLEDALADSQKIVGRRTVEGSLAKIKHGVRCVRVNGVDTGLMFGDIEAIVSSSLDAVVLPKVTSVDLLQIVDGLLSRCESDLGLQQGHIGLYPLIETAAGVQRVGEIALNAPQRVRQLVFGLGDFSADAGVDVGADGLELLYARSAIVVASRAADLPGPIDGPYLKLHDEASLVSDTERSRRLGFVGRVLIHPEQVRTAHRVFSELDEPRLRRAMSIVEEFKRAEASGQASITVGDDFVDYPIYHQQNTLLARHNEATVHEGE